MPASHQKKIQHLYLRAAFGATPQQVDEAANHTLESRVNHLFNESNRAYDLDSIKYPLKKDGKKGASGFRILKMILKSRRQLEDLNIVWLNRMAGGRTALRERMTFFWHNHFATSTPFGYLMQEQNNTFRKLALGRFSDLLHAIARDPAMIIYLNNQQNKKDAPNENFARELMELFTLGEGNYAEKDIKEAARAFTGWAVNRRGEYTFIEHQHDGGTKEFLGRKGNFGGEDILNILLEQRQTAVFIVSKIYREFVNDTLPPDRIAELAAYYFDTGYDTGLLMKKILLSDWFYDEMNIGCRICSPVELVVRLKRILDLQFEDDTVLLKMQKALGQVLFFPPNVAGWKGGASWIDSSSLMLRLSLAPAMMHNGKIVIRPKPEFEERPADLDDNVGHKVISDWSLFTNRFASLAGDDLQRELTGYLIQCNANRIQPMETFGMPAPVTAQDRVIKTAAYLMSIPEFQLI